jgi:8-oxo-dGTP diphosphatase
VRSVVIRLLPKRAADLPGTTDVDNWPPTPEYKFCPRCGGALDLKRLKVKEPERLVCAACQFVFFLDPKLAACSIFSVEGRIVLGRRAIEPALGRWVFPGGFVDRGETVEQAAIREAREEMNVEVKLVDLLNVYSYAERPVVIIVYAAEIVGGDLSAADECLEVRGFAPEEIPWTELAFTSTRDALREYVRRYFCVRGRSDASSPEGRFAELPPKGERP